MLNKAEMITRYQHINGSTKKDAINAVETVLSILEVAVLEGEEIAVSGYFKGHVKNVKARTARNPQTGEDVNVPAKEKYVLKAGSRLQSVVEL